MKRNVLLLFIGLLLGNTLLAQDIVSNWVAPILPTEMNKKTRSQFTKVKINKEKKLFIFGTFGSNNNYTLTQSFLGKDFTGTPSAGISMNKNLVLTKCDLDGSIIWGINSDAGDVSISQSVIIPTTDGGAFLALKVRHTNRNNNNKNLLLRIVNNDGTKDQIEWVFPNDQVGDNSYHWVYQAVLIKVSSQGKVTMLTHIPVDFLPEPDTTSNHYKDATPDGFYFYAGCEDNEGNIYLGGNIRKTMTFGSNELQPHNTGHWTGDSQKNVGSSFIVKLDAQGNYLHHFESAGSATFDNIKAMTLQDDKLLITGNVRGKAIENTEDPATTQQVSFGEYSFTPSTFTNAYAAQLDTDLAVSWVKYYPFVNTQSKKNWKIADIQADKENFYICGAITGGIATEQGNTIVNSASKMLNGYLLKCNSTDGTILQGSTEAQDNIGLMTSIICGKDSVYAYGYSFADKIYLNSYSKDLVKANTYSLVTNGGFATSYAAVGIGDTLVVTGVTGGRYLPSFYKTEQTYTEKPLTYTAFAAEWTFTGRHFSENENGTPSGIQEYSKNKATVLTTEGGINIQTSTATNLSIYSYNGTLLLTEWVEEGTHFFSIPQGFYLVRIGEKSYKTLVH